MLSLFHCSCLQCIFCNFQSSLLQHTIKISIIPVHLHPHICNLMWIKCNSYIFKLRGFYNSLHTYLSCFQCTQLLLWATATAESGYIRWKTEDTFASCSTFYFEKIFCYNSIAFGFNWHIYSHAHTWSSLLSLI